jgi:uncharacterized protein (DUF433 family)
LTAQLAPRIVVDPAIRFGRPVIEGTRVPVDLLLALLSGGMTVAEVAAEYDVAIEDIQTGLQGRSTGCRRIEE